MKYLLLVLLLITLLVNVPLSSAGKNQTLPFMPAEELVYEGEFSRLLLRGINIVELRFKTIKDTAISSGECGCEIKPSNNLKLTGEVTSKGWFTSLFGINFKYLMETTVEPEGMLFIKSTSLDEQGKRVRASETTFDKTRKEVSWIERDPKDSSRPARRATHIPKLQTHTVVSALYYLRTLELKEGLSYQLSISDSGREYIIPVAVADKRMIKSVVGEVETIKVDAKVFGKDGILDGVGDFSVWFTTDKSRIPVQGRINHDFGRLDIKLKKIIRPSSSV
jgi:hypothetical protein